MTSFYSLQPKKSDINRRIARLEVWACASLIPDPELAKTNRSGCSNTECKHSGEKIAKGALRHGVVSYPFSGIISPLVALHEVCDMFRQY